MWANSSITTLFSISVLAGVLSAQGSPDLKELIRQTRSDNQQVRVDALEKLASYGPRAAPVAQELCDLIADPKFRQEAFTISGAITAVGEIGTEAKRCIPVLERVVRDRRVDSVSQGAASISIKKIKLNDRDPEVRVQAATDLGGAGTQVIPNLRNALKDPDPRVRAAALRSIKLIESRSKPAA